MHLLLSILTALTVLSVPKDKVGTPVLYGSRIVDVNRAHGKVFAPGQRNPRPQVMEFVRRDSVLMLVPDNPSRRRGPGPRPVVFPIVEETADAFAISLEPYFSTYPEEISAIPPKMLPGHAVEHELSCPPTPPEWLQVNGRYRYRDGLEVTAACYFLWLREKPLPPIDLDPTKVGYNSVEGRHPEGRYQRWDLTGGRKLDFYVDKTFPEAWYPYIKEGIEDWNQAFRACGLGDVLDQRLQDAANLKIVGWFVRSPRSIYTSKGPASCLADLAGTKIRIMESPLMSKAMTLLGMIPVPLAATERYMALQTGTVDAAENSVPLIITQAEYEVTDYVILTEHFCTPNVMAMDLDFYNDLPDDLKQIVDECGAEAGTYSSNLDKESLEDALDKLANEYGMTICEIEDKTEFMEAVAPLYDEYRDTIGQDIYDFFGK